jgi:hypothetical protein
MLRDHRCCFEISERFSQGLSRYSRDLICKGFHEYTDAYLCAASPLLRHLLNSYYSPTRESHD